MNNNPNPQSIDNHSIEADNELDDNAVIYKAYKDIVAELKKMLRYYPPRLRCYIEVEDATVHRPCNEYFIHPLVKINVFETKGCFILSYTRFQSSPHLIPHHWLDIVRCILKHTSKDNTVLDIEEFVREDFHLETSYQTAVEKYNSGDLRYEEHFIQYT